MSELDRGINMSHVPYTTQIGPYPSMYPGSQAGTQFILVFLDSMGQHHASLMKEAQRYLETSVNIRIVHGQELRGLHRETKYFVISHPKDDLIKRIQNQFVKPVIYTARSIIEARAHRGVKLPSRTLAFSLSMYYCHIFLVKSCNEKALIQKINEMCGNLVERFSDEKLNVVITKRGDDKYCSKAFGRNVAIVSPNWIEECYNYSTKDDPSYFQHDALKTLDEHQIKPFYGLHFKIDVPHSASHIKKLIQDNQGKISYGSSCPATHIVRLSVEESENQHRNDNNQSEPKVVDVEFLEACSKSGYYLSRKEYSDYKQDKMDDSVVRVKQEKVSQSTVSHQTNARYDEAQSTTPTLQPTALSSFVPPQNERRIRSNETQTTIMPPPQVPRQSKPSDMESMVLRAMRGFENGVQTQLASTQISRLPENEIRIERQVEPSQQIYWA